MNYGRVVSPSCYIAFLAEDVTNIDEIGGLNGREMKGKRIKSNLGYKTRELRVKYGIFMAGNGFLLWLKKGMNF